MLGVALAGNLSGIDGDELLVCAGATGRKQVVHIIAVFFLEDQGILEASD